MKIQFARKIVKAIKAMDEGIYMLDDPSNKAYASDYQRYRESLLTLLVVGGFQMTSDYLVKRKPL